MKKCWYQQNSKNMSRDSYTVLSFIIAGYVWQIFVTWGFPLPHPKKPILNRVNSFPFFWSNKKLRKSFRFSHHNIVPSASCLSDIGWIIFAAVRYQNDKIPWERGCCHPYRPRWSVIKKGIPNSQFLSIACVINISCLNVLDIL